MVQGLIFQDLMGDPNHLFQVGMCAEMGSITSSGDDMLTSNSFNT
jgi:hypothetical protein